MSKNRSLKPYVFITIKGYKSIVITPNSDHTLKSWERIKKQIVDTYVKECIYGGHDSSDNRREDIEKALAFFERHAQEWRYSYLQGASICNWLLV